jgi:hypothetical protein
MKSTDRRCRVYVSLMAMTLTAAFIISSGWKTLNEDSLGSVTVIHKNQVHPSIDELMARTAQPEQSDKASSDQLPVIPGRGRWI